MGNDRILTGDAACRPWGPGHPPFPGALEAGAEYRRHPDGAVVLPQGAPAAGAFLVAAGHLKVIRRSGGGKGQLLAILAPGTWAGAAQALAGGDPDASFEAHGGLEGWLIPAGALRLRFLQDPGLRETLLRDLAEQTRRLVRLAGALSLHTVPERVAQLLLDTHGRTGRGSLVEFQWTQEDLACGLGASREAFSRALPILAELGFIQSTFPVVRILDRPGLERFAQGGGRPRAVPWIRGTPAPGRMPESLALVEVG